MSVLPCALALLLLSAGAAQAATLHVSQSGSDGGPCSQAAPCRTINGGLARMGSGDTLLIGSGTYTDDFIEDWGGAPPPSGSSWASPTTIKAAPGATVWLAGTRNSEGGFISLERTRYLVVDGLNLNGLRPDGGGVWTFGIGGGKGSSHVRYQNMELKHFRGAVKVDGDHNEFLGLDVHSNGKPQCPPDSPGCVGMYLSGNNNLIAHSRLHDNDCYGIQIYYPEQAAPVTGNIIRDSQAYNNGCAGILAQPGNTIANNVIHDNLTGIQTTGSTVIGNRVWGNGEGGDLAIGSSEASGNLVGAEAAGAGPPPSLPSGPQTPQLPPQAIPPSRPPTPTLPPRPPSTVRPPSTTPIPLATTSTPAPPAPEVPVQRSPMGITTDLIDSITSAFLAALRAGGTNLGVYSLAILALCATIAFYKEYALVIMYGTGLGDALAGLLVYVMGAMGYYWLMVNLFPMAEAALTTAIQWGLAGTGGTPLTAEMITKPSFIMQEGLKAAYPVAEQAGWFERVWASIKMINNPGDMIGYWFVVLAFLAITAHHMMMLIEYHLAVICAAVLIPWGLWSATSSVGEFAVGWLTGGFIRALVSTTMLGIALPLFQHLNKPAEGFITLYHTATLIGGAFIFAVLCWVIPARAAGIASRGMALAVHGGTVTAAAMSFARFGMMAHGAGAVATRAHSRMMAAREMTRAA